MFPTFVFQTKGLEQFSSTAQRAVDRRRLDGGDTIVQRVPSGVPSVHSPNLISVGEGFGLFLFLGEEHGYDSYLL